MAAVKSEPKEGSSSAADSDLEGIANSDDSEPEETYEEARERQIAENRALLSQLGLDQLGLPPPVDDHLRVKREPKPPVDPASLRRNSRRQSQSASIVYNGRELKRRTFTGEYLDHRPERALAPPAIVYGHIPGIPVGRTWDYRAHLGEVHDGGLRVRSTNALQPAASLCIYSTTVSAANTAWQSALDSGDRFTFISAYGNYNFSDRERSGQVRDQTWGHEVHKALLRNVEEDREVRVIRGSKSESRWAPEEGELDVGGPMGGTTLIDASSLLLSAFRPFFPVLILRTLHPSTLVFHITPLYLDQKASGTTVFTKSARPGSSDRP